MVLFAGFFDTTFFGVFDFFDATFFSVLGFFDATFFDFFAGALVACDFFDFDFFGADLFDFDFFGADFFDFFAFFCAESLDFDLDFEVLTPNDVLEGLAAREAREAREAEAEAREAEAEAREAEAEGREAREAREAEGREGREAREAEGREVRLGVFFMMLFFAVTLLPKGLRSTEPPRPPRPMGCRRAARALPLPRACLAPNELSLAC